MKNIKYLFAFLLSICLLFILGCSSRPVNEYVYRTEGEDIVDSFYIEKTQYYTDKVVIYWNGTININDYEFSDDFELKRNTLVLKTDNPKEFNSFYMSFDDISYSFRYLNSDQYACLYTVMDSEGGIHESGSIDRYYTEEEINKKNEYVQKRKEEQEELFRRLEGTWSTSDGEFFTIYKDDDYSVDYSLEDREGSEDQISFTDHVYAKENYIAICYIDGPFQAGFTFILSDDGESFELEYEDKIFYREGANSGESNVEDE